MEGQEVALNAAIAPWEWATILQLVGDVRRGM